MYLIGDGVDSCSPLDIYFVLSLSMKFVDVNCQVFYLVPLTLKTHSLQTVGIATD